MKKKYICRLSGLTILVKVRNIAKRIEFNRAVINPFGLVGCAFSTEDEALQHAIEHHPLFRNGQRDGIWLYGEPFEKAMKEVAVAKPVVEAAKEEEPKVEEPIKEEVVEVPVEAPVEEEAPKRRARRIKKQEE